MKIILAAFVLSLFTGRIVFGGVVSLSRIFYWIALALLIYCYIRMFSRNIYKRAEENRWFLNKHPICGDSGAIENTKHSR